MESASQTDLTRALAEEITALGYDDLAPGDIGQVKRLILDHIGVCRRGAALDWAGQLAQWAESVGQGPCILFGRAQRVAPSMAAFVNASAAHGMELDDTHDESVTHPGAVVIATALAVGSAVGASGPAVIAAIVAGYEVMARVGMATGAGTMIEAGFHPTALFGGFGAATTAGKLHGLSADDMVRAWGLMLSTAGGSMQFSEDPHGTTVKRLHAGYGAHNGTMAAELARLGIAGPAQAFDGRYGLCALYGAQPDPSRLSRTEGAPYEIHRISLKPYPCCRLFHSTIDALREVTDDFTTADSAIATLRVGGPDIMVTQHMMRRPSSVMAAQYSLPFALGAALAYGPTRYDGYTEERLADSRILALADKVEAVADRAMQAAFPEHFGSWVELVDRDGTTRRADVLDSHGTPARPMSTEAIAEKVEGLLADLDDAPPVAILTDAVEALEREGGLAALLSRCGPSADQTSRASVAE